MAKSKSSRTKATARTADTFQNFVARVGFGTGNQNDASQYGFHPISRNRLQMEWCYRGSWIAGRVIDCVARDMTREGVDPNTTDDPKKMQELEKENARLRLWSQLCQTIKWARLYGGACAFMMIDGQDPQTPLRLETVGQGQFKGLLPLDRWLLQPSLQDLVSEYGPNYGKPKFYQTVPDTMGMPLMTIHHSRVIRLEGVELPYWQRISENLWGQSVLERMWDRLIAYDSTTTGVAQLVYKAHLRTIKISGLKEMIAAGGQMMTGVAQQVQMIGRFQSNEGITLLDKDDEFDVKPYSFSGLDAVLVQFGEQLCGAVEIPAVRLFGQSPAGFNSGDSDLRSYYDTIKQNQVADLGPGLEILYKVAYASCFGTQPPKQFGIEFVPLWQLNEIQKSEVVNTRVAALDTAFQSQGINRATYMKELKQMSKETGVFTNIDQADIQEAEQDPAPDPEMLGLVAPKMPMNPAVGGDLKTPKPETARAAPKRATGSALNG